MSSHRGRAYLVTGAASGIGRALTEQLLSEGAGVVALDRDGEGLEQLADGALRSAGSGSGGEVVPAVLDVADEAAVATAVRDGARRLGGLSGVATCAGVFVGGDFADVAELDLDVFRSVLEVNLVGTVAAIKHALPHLARPGGAVVTVASTAALEGNGRGSGYTASKGAVDAFTRLLAVRYGREGIRATLGGDRSEEFPKRGAVAQRGRVFRQDDLTRPHHVDPIHQIERLANVLLDQ